MKGKYGVIVRVPNYILEYPPWDSPTSAQRELSDLIWKHMDIDVNKCYISIEQDFAADISLVKLTSGKPVDGLFLHNSFSQLVSVNFPVEKVIE